MRSLCGRSPDRATPTTTPRGLQALTKCLRATFLSLREKDTGEGSDLGRRDWRGRGDCNLTKKRPHNRHPERSARAVEGSAVKDLASIRDYNRTSKTIQPASQPGGRTGVAPEERSFFIRFAAEGGGEALVGLAVSAPADGDGECGGGDECDAGGGDPG
jgi:hypothetical protein